MCVQRRLFRKLIVRTDCAVGRKAACSMGLCIIRHCRLTSGYVRCTNVRSAYKRQPVPHSRRIVHRFRDFPSLCVCVCVCVCVCACVCLCVFLSIRLSVCPSVCCSTRNVREIDRAIATLVLENTRG